MAAARGGEGGAARAYRVTFETNTFLHRSKSSELSRLRRIYNSKLRTANAGVPLLPIPRSAFAWLWWNERWVELGDSKSLRAALNDEEYLAYLANTDGVVEVRFTVSGVMDSSVASASGDVPPPVLSADLLQRLQFLVRDLSNYTSDDRFLWDILHPSSLSPEEAALFAGLCLSSLYFSPAEQRFLADYPTASGATCATLVMTTVARKFAPASASKSATGAHVCTSHDLAPLYREVFGLGREFERSRAFKSAYARFDKWCRRRMREISAPRRVEPAAAAGHSEERKATEADERECERPEELSDLPESLKQRLKERLKERNELRLAQAPPKQVNKLERQISELEKHLRRLEIKAMKP